MRTLLVAFALATAACGPFHYRTAMPRPPVCVVGGNEPLQMSMDDYGSTYTSGMNGPAPWAPETHLAASNQVAGDCVAPPWWIPPD